MAFRIFSGCGARVAQRAMQTGLRSRTKAFPKNANTAKCEISSLGYDATLIVNLVALASPSATAARAFQQRIKQMAGTLTPEQKLNLSNNLVGFATTAAGLLTTAVGIAIDRVTEMAETKAELSSEP